MNSRVGIRGLRQYSEQMPRRSKRASCPHSLKLLGSGVFAVSQGRQSLVLFPALPHYLRQNCLEKDGGKKHTPHPTPLPCSRWAYIPLKQLSRHGGNVSHRRPPVRGVRRFEECSTETTAELRPQAQRACAEAAGAA